MDGQARKMTISAIRFQRDRARFAIKPEWRRWHLEQALILRWFLRNV